MQRIQVDFSRNVDRLMTLRGKRNTEIAEAVGVSRQMVSLWRRGSSMPTEDREIALAKALGCTVDELFQPNNAEAPAMMPISQWALREGIPVGRAKTLFRLGILTGDVGGAVGGLHLVPVGLHAPDDSKRVVKLAQKAPPAISAFAINFDFRMRELRLGNEEIAAMTKVRQSAVTHWRSGRGHPLECRLPAIAEKLGCSVEALMARPTEQQIADWTFRYNRTWEQAEHEAA